MGTTEYLEPIERLVESFRLLPGVGGKTAVRMAFAALDFTEEETEAFSEALLNAKRLIRRCSRCGNITTGELCSICEDPTRDPSMICVVENARDIMAFERVREYHGLYHVLGGALSPVNGITPAVLHIPELLERVRSEGAAEVIVATDPDVEGEATAMYLAKLLGGEVKVTRLAYGIPVGGNLEYTDEVTLHRALRGRSDLN